jgi:flagellar motor switch protein FliN/FliY
MSDTLPAIETSRPLELLKNVPVQITVELGRKKVRLGELLQLGTNAVLELPTLVGDLLEVRVNDRLVARGEAVAIGDRYGIRICEVVADDIAAEGQA